MSILRVRFRDLRRAGHQRQGLLHHLRPLLQRGVARTKTQPQQGDQLFWSLQNIFWMIIFFHQDLWSESNRVSELELVPGTVEPGLDWAVTEFQYSLFPVNLELIKNLWLPNIFIYNLKSFKTIDVLSKLAGLWIDSKKRIYYSQATHITFICPMVFDSFPLDTQRCKFQVTLVTSSSCH